MRRKYPDCERDDGNCTACALTSGRSPAPSIAPMKPAGPPGVSSMSPASALRIRHGVT